MTQPADGQRPAELEDLEFGPSGYLPKRASQRARKIILRAPLGVQWIVASVVAGVVVVVAGIWFFSQSSQPPAAPYEATMHVSDIDGIVGLDDEAAVAVSAAGPVRVFVVPQGVNLQLCEISGRLESATSTWSAASGRGNAVESLDRHPSRVHDGILYVDFTTTEDGPAASSTAIQPAC